MCTVFEDKGRKKMRQCKFLQITHEEFSILTSKECKYCTEYSCTICLTLVCEDEQSRQYNASG